MKINFEIKDDTLFTICHYCLGSGKLKAMQSAITYDRGAIRYSDKELKCTYCKGKGIVKHE